MKKTFLIGTVLASTLAAQAVIYTTNWNSSFANGGVVPDNNYSGWTDTRTVDSMPAGTLQAVAVDLNLSSGWTGDLYAYLQSESGFVVLLDHVGVPDAGASGYGAGTMDITLADGSSWDGNGISGNIHLAGANAVGHFNPDDSMITSGSGSLGSFTTANGTWTLFIADLSGGGVTTVTDWGLQMDIVAVPEVETWIAAALAGAFGAFWLKRQIWNGVESER